MKFLIEVLESRAPLVTPLLTIWQHVAGESLAKEQDRQRQSDPERFASLVESLHAGGSTLATDFKHNWITALVAAERRLLCELLAEVDGVATIAPEEYGGKCIALISAGADQWRDVVVTCLSEDPPLGDLVADLYRSLCKHGYASMWRDYSAKTTSGRLSLEHK